MRCLNWLRCSVRKHSTSEPPRMCGCRSSETQRAKNLRVGRPGRMRPGLHKDIYRRYLALYPSPADPMESWGYDKYWNKLLALKILRAKYSFQRTYSNP